MNLRQRHAIARKGINYLLKLGVNPRDVKPYLYQSFLRNGFNPEELPVYDVYNVSFQMNYLKPEDKKNSKFILNSAKTFKVYVRVGDDTKKIKDSIIDIVEDYFGHEELTEHLKIQGLESENEQVLSYDVQDRETDGIYVESNDNISFDLQFVRGQDNIKGRKYRSEDYSLINYL